MTGGDQRGDERPATFRDALAVPAFRWLWLGQLLSILGDQVARVALSVLVFDRTASAALTALTYALTFLPDLVAGPLLSGLADRFPRRRVMVVTDVVRALLVAAMAVPGMPLPALATLLVAGQLLAAPFLAARSAILPHLLTGDRYVAGNAVISTTYQVAQVLGFALGGPLVALLGVSPALAANAATFLVSAVVLRLGVPEQAVPDAGSVRPGLRGEAARVVAGARVVGADPRLRALIGLACISAFVVTVEGLAAPYAAELGVGTAAVGLLLAANPLGQVVGILLLTRLVAPARRPRLIGPLAVASCVPLVVSAFGPPLWVLIVAWVVSGMACAYQVPANATFVVSVDDARRGQAFGLAVTALRVTQGVGVLLAGVLAQRTTPSVAVAVGGAVGVVVAGLAARAWSRASAHPPRRSSGRREDAGEDTAEEAA
ncbi:MFS transporter [Actinomycetospora sp. NBRC 106378]|uniref:MFS transporter n=1 Tax=Actinomycetospora sp. NBRC 106378 TaxID=3032208 RepID=UPI0024A3D16C|nr:MFS transporter [Actinomycetospora sp. NBRC 106378]GLZ52054.1 MFS transporter [Actinomycetospora sp. NBRC 106378]